MPQPMLHVPLDDPTVAEGLAAVRAQFEVPGPHEPGVVAEAERAAPEVLAGLDGPGRRDARDLELFTVDPPGSMDLDQALHIARRGPGLRVHYAIADVAAFVAPGGPLDQACWARGVTYYLPDGRASLHPGALGEAAARLLPGADRAAVLWTFDLDAHGVVTANSVERAVVR
ncbi:MAG: RNB domain-containing ribonuclease, partial [Acidimicrobiia bacterium]